MTFRFSILPVLLIVLASLIACGSDSPEDGPTNGGSSQPAAVVKDESQASETTPVATSNKRPLANQGYSRRASGIQPAGTQKPTNSVDQSRLKNSTPIAQPGSESPTQVPTPNVNPAQSTGVPEGKKDPAATTPTQQTPQPTEVVSIPKSVEDLIPVNPQFTDEVLLQDIYAQMDLGQFALDPAAEIQMPNTRRGKPMSLSNLERPDTHPPGKFNLADVRDHPYLHMFPGLKYSVEQALGSPPPDGLIEYGPHLDLDSLQISSADPEFVPKDGISRFIHNPWFEPIPARSYKKFFREQQLNMLHSEYPYIYQNLGPHWFGNNSTRGVLSNLVAKALEDAKQPGAEMRTMPWQTYRDNYEELEWRLDDYLRTPVYEFDRAHRELKLEEHSFRVPTTHWEFVHPKLPILKITSHVATTLPLGMAGQEPEPTYFAVSFVVSFRNRWGSFGDPDRWLVRFEEDLKDDGGQFVHQSFTTFQGAIDEELHQARFPDYWHWSDYMQHRIIGPVVVQVYESDVIEPGYPLPGHVITNAYTAPGTDGWDKFQMDDNEW